MNRTDYLTGTLLFAAEAIVICIIILLAQIVLKKIDQDEDDKVTMEVTETPETVQLCAKNVRHDYVSGMPCDMTEETAHFETETVDEAEETIDETKETVDETKEEPYRNHTVDGHTFAMEEFLYNMLAQYGREDFIVYALCQCYQESRFDVYAVNPNMHDKGLFQFKDTYWEYHASEAGFSGADIFDPYVQCAVYAYWVDKRFDQSADLYTTISDHYTGGCGYNSQYVSDVLQWLSTVE